MATLFALVMLVFFGAIWMQAYMSNATVRFVDLIGMSLRRVPARTIVTARVMGVQAGLDEMGIGGTSTNELEAHYLAGGDVMQVLRAIIAARQAGMDLDFDRAASIDLAGRDAFEAVLTSVVPKIIDCPDPEAGEKPWISAISRDGIELRVKATVTVRTCLDQLIGGATEKTIIARVGQGIISSIGSSDSYADVLSSPIRISKEVLDRGLNSNTAFDVISIDIAEIDVGDNIGARLQIDQAEADTRMARATAESRRAMAVALKQEWTSECARARAEFVLAESQIPTAVASAFQNDRPIVFKETDRLRMHRPAG
ncbi:MAG: flotillin-like FloA family protein [Planctomycetota bacterium]